MTTRENERNNTRSRGTSRQFEDRGLPTDEFRDRHQGDEADRHTPVNLPLKILIIQLTNLGIIFFQKFRFAGVNQFFSIFSDEKTCLLGTVATAFTQIITL